MYFIFFQSDSRVFSASCTEVVIPIGLSARIFRFKFPCSEPHPTVCYLCFYPLRDHWNPGAKTTTICSKQRLVEAMLLANHTNAMRSRDVLWFWTQGASGLEGDTLIDMEPWFLPNANLFALLESYRPR